MRREGGPQPVVHEIPVHSKFFEHIEKGSKRWEVRVCYDRFSSIKTGDAILFTTGSGNKIQRRVLEIKRNHNMEGLLDEVDPEDIMPGYTHEDILAGWKGIPNSAKEEELGIIAFKINE